MNGRVSTADTSGAVGGRTERLPTRLTVLLGLILAAHASLAWQVRQRALFTFGDDAAYLLLARSLRALSYREPQYIGEPIAARFPPGYPGLLAVWTAIFGERFDAIAALGIIASVVGLMALFAVVRRRWSPELGLLVVAVTAVNPTMVTIAGATATEAVFTALTLGALWAADRGDTADARGGSGIMAGALTIAAALTRSAGVTLAAALGVHWLLRRRWRWAAVFAVAFTLTVGAWLGWTAIAPRREVRRSYVDDAVNVRTADGTLAGTLVARIRSNSVAYGSQIVISELRLPVTSRSALDNVAWVVVIGTLAVIGLVAAWRSWNVAVLYMVAYGGLLLVWPYKLERFVAPVIPLIVTFVLIGAWVVGRRRTGMSPAAVGAATAALLAAFALVRDGKLVEDAMACARTRVDCAPPATLDFVDAARFVAESTPPNARFVSPKNSTLFYFSGRQSEFWDDVLANDSASFLPYLRDRKIGYVLATPVFVRYRELYRLVLQNCAYFDVVRAYSPLTMILALRDVPRDDGRSAPACTAMTRALERPVVE